MRNIILVFTLLTFLGQNAFSQSELALILDHKEAPIRESKKAGATVLTSINAGELFLCEPSSDALWAVKRFNDRLGYLPKSRIGLVKNQSLKVRKDLIEAALLKMQDYQNLPSEELEKRQDELVYFEQNEYAFLLDLLPDVFCKSKDAELFENFLHAISADASLENEIPLLSLGSCYIGQPDLVLELIDKQAENEKMILKKELSIGFEKITWAREDEVTDYNSLKNRLVNWSK